MDISNEELADYLSAMTLPDPEPEDYSMLAEAATRLRSKDSERLDWAQWHILSWRELVASRAEYQYELTWIDDAGDCHKTRRNTLRAAIDSAMGTPE